MDLTVAIGKALSALSQFHHLDGVAGIGMSSVGAVIAEIPGIFVGIILASVVVIFLPNILNSFSFPWSNSGNINS